MLGPMAHTVKDKEKLVARIGRIRGQLNAVERALIQEKDCYQILQTTAACRGAMNSLMAEILEGHIRFHLLEHTANRKKERERAAYEIIDVLNAFLK